MSEYNYKEVRFDEYCEKCINKDKPEEDDTCAECLEEPMNEYSHKPVRFISKESDKSE